jgi:hypothetical protein
MKPITTTRALFIAALFATSSAFAGAEVHKCVGSAGKVLLTDEACPADTETVKIIAGPAQADDGIVQAVTTAPEDVAAAPIAVATAGIVQYRMSRYASMTVPRKPRGMALDVAMLKQARANLALQDVATHRTPRALPGPRMAGR